VLDFAFCVLSAQLLRAEIAIMKLVHHPNIIRMETVYESRQHIFIVMELHSGGELFDRIVGRPRFSENEAFSVIYPLVESVAYLHEMGIVHRDLKVSSHALC
jgi:calcium/calmodulin-dependent protein kinase I